MNARQFKQREAYLLANRDPWMLWRLQALRAGYIPPLIHGQIPRDMAGLSFEPKQETYDIEPLMKHAKRVRFWHKGLAIKLFALILTLVLMVGSLSYFLTQMDTTRFKVNLLNVIFPHYEDHTTMRMD